MASLPASNDTRGITGEPIQIDGGSKLYASASPQIRQLDAPLDAAIPSSRASCRDESSNVAAARFCRR